MRRNSLSMAVGTLMALGILGGCGGDAGEDASEPMPADEAPSAMPEPPAATPAGDATAMVEAGHQVFTGQGLCFTCHGQEAQGTPLAPSLADGEWLWIENPGADLEGQLVTLIRAGVPQPKEHPAPMPPMGGAQLTDEQLNQVAAYVASLSS